MLTTTNIQMNDAIFYPAIIWIKLPYKLYANISLRIDHTDDITKIDPFQSSIKIIGNQALLFYKHA